MDTTISTLDEVKGLVAEVLGIQDRLDSMDGSTGMLGSMPELDSLAVVGLVTAIEERFGFEVDQADFTADVLETLGTLTSFVAANRA